MLRTVAIVLLLPILLACEGTQKSAQGPEGEIIVGALNNGAVSLRSNSGQFVVAEANGTANANRSVIGSWEKFRVKSEGDGLVSFLSHHNTYLTAEQDWSVAAKRKRLDGRALFRPEPQLDGRFAFRSTNGKYLTSSPSGTLRVNALDVIDRTMFVVAKTTIDGPVGGGGRITVVGTDDTYSPEELRQQLAKEGLRLVEDNEIAEGECAVVYPSANERDLDAEFGVLACEVRIGDSVTLQTRAVYGECDASLSNGAGAECEVGVASQKIKADFPGGESEFSVKGPNASVCGSVTKDKLCANAGATLAESSIEVKDKRGNGVGMGVSVGVGAGVDGGFENGVLSGSLDLRGGIGASISFSVNVNDIGDKAMWVGETGYVLVSNEVVAASKDVAAFYDDELAPGITDASGKIVTVADEAGKTVVRTFSGSPIDVLKRAPVFISSPTTVTAGVPIVTPIVQFIVDLF